MASHSPAQLRPAAPSRHGEPVPSRPDTQPVTSPFLCARRSDAKRQAGRPSATPPYPVDRQSFPISMQPSASLSMTLAACAERGSKESSEFMFMRPRGAFVCLECCSGVLRKHARSNGKFGRALSKTSVPEISGALPRSYGRSRRRLTWHLSPTRTNAQPRVGFQVNSNRL
jgi:hypothetical protein